MPEQSLAEVSLCGGQAENTLGIVLDDEAREPAAQDTDAVKDDQGMIRHVGQGAPAYRGQFHPMTP